MEPISLDLIKRGLLKRFWLIVGFTAVCSMVSLAIAFIIPPRYTAGAKIVVESQQIPTSLAQPTVTATAKERLELIKQRLMTRQSLSELIERLDLFANDELLSTAEKVRKVRGSTNFQTIRLGGRGRNGGAVAAFVLAYSSTDPQEAAKIANEMVTMILEQNLQSRSQRATQTLEFFDREVERLQSELVEVETALAQFKRENRDALPEGLEYRQRELADLRSRRFDLQRELLALGKRKQALEDRLAAGKYGPEFERERSPQQVALAQLEQNLSQASAIYAPSHPTIRRLRTQIAQIESSIDPTATDAEDLATARERAREELVEEIALVEREIEIGNREVDEIAKRTEELEEAIDRTPQVGIDLNGLLRNQARLQAEYQRALKKRGAAETGQKLEVDQKSERFEVVDQATAPSRPDSPNRPKIAAAGTIGAFGFAAGLAILLEMLSRVIYSSSDLERRMQLRPLISVPYIKTERDIRRRRRNIVLLVVAAVVLPLVALVAIDTYYAPLSYLAEQVLDRFGVTGMAERLMERLGL